MFDLQTVTCLHDIPVIRSSTDKLQNVYAKAKDTSRLIRYPCHIAETIADKSLKIAATVANPLVKPLSRPVRFIDDFAVDKLRQIEAKYPAINTSTENVLNKLHGKTEPVRNAINTVKNTTTSTIQHGKETVTSAATATINKATDMADTVYSFCETHVPGETKPVNRNDFSRRTTFLWERIKTSVVIPINSAFIWTRLFIVSFLLRIKQTTDVILNRIQTQSFLTYLPKRFLIYLGILLEFFMERIRPIEQNKQESTACRTAQQKPFVSRQTLKPGAFVATRQNAVVTKDDTVNTRTGLTQSQIDTPLSSDSNYQTSANNDKIRNPRLHADDTQEFLPDN